MFAGGQSWRGYHCGIEALGKHPGEGFRISGFRTSKLSPVDLGRGLGFQGLGFRILGVRILGGFRA